VGNRDSSPGVIKEVFVLFVSKSRPFVGSGQVHGCCFLFFLCWSLYAKASVVPEDQHLTSRRMLYSFRIECLHSFSYEMYSRSNLYTLIQEETEYFQKFITQ
jgi:hypothetical protein